MQDIKQQEEKMNRILEKFAEQEHIRWAKWQNYLHSFLTWNNDIQAWVLPHEKKCHWQMQINTPYAMLSEKEKDSDREQVKPYLNFIQSEISLAVEQEKDRVLAMVLKEIEQMTLEANDRPTIKFYVDGILKATNTTNFSSDIEELPITVNQVLNTLKTKLQAKQ